jgi:hypothetical protein
MHNWTTVDRANYIHVAPSVFSKQSTKKPGALPSVRFLRAKSLPRARGVRALAGISHQLREAELGSVLLTKKSACSSTINGWIDVCVLFGKRCAHRLLWIIA